MYKIIFNKSALKSFDKLDRFGQETIGKKIEHLKQNPFLGKPLTANLAGLWSLRIGKYRVIYQIQKEELIVFILDVGHRKNIYSSHQ